MASAVSPTAAARPISQPSLDEPQLSKVAILLAIEKVDAEIEAVNSKLAALAKQSEEDKDRYVICFLPLSEDASNLLERLLMRCTHLLLVKVKRIDRSDFCGCLSTSQNCMTGFPPFQGLPAGA